MRNKYLEALCTLGVNGYDTFTDIQAAIKRCEKMADIESVYNEAIQRAALVRKDAIAKLK